MQSIDGNAKGTPKITQTKRKRKNQQLTNGNRGQATKETKDQRNEQSEQKTVQRARETRARKVQKEKTKL